VLYESLLNLRLFFGSDYVPSVFFLAIIYILPPIHPIGKREYQERNPIPCRRKISLENCYESKSTHDDATVPRATACAIGRFGASLAAR
jgi:hypothetical protein